MKFPFQRKSEKDDNTGLGRFADEGFYRGDEDEDEGIVDDDLYAQEPSEPVNAPSGKTVSSSGDQKIKVVKPHTSTDGRGVADYLMKGYTVVINIEEMDRGQMIRMVDFLMGTLYVLGGELRRVTKTTLVLSPRSGEMSGEDEE